MPFRVALLELLVPLVHVGILEPDGTKELDPLVNIHFRFCHDNPFDTIFHCEAVEESSPIVGTSFLAFRDPLLLYFTMV